MTINAVCEKCEAKIAAPDKAAGRTVKCPKCGASVWVTAVNFESVNPKNDEPRQETSAGEKRLKRSYRGDGEAVEIKISWDKLPWEIRMTVMLVMITLALFWIALCLGVLWQVLTGIAILRAGR